MSRSGSSPQRTAAEVQRAADILQRIRSMAVRAGPVNAPVAMNPLIDEAVLFLGHELTRQGIEVKLELANDLPVLVGDRVQLQQVIVNLAINAIQSMTAAPPGTRVLTFRTRAAHPRSQVIEVEDSGPGIEPGMLERLFDVLSQQKPPGWASDSPSADRSSRRQRLGRSRDEKSGGFTRRGVHHRVAAAAFSLKTGHP